jgi:hypothetical protein
MGRLGRVVVGGLALAGFLLLVSLAGTPRPDTEVSGIVRRQGGACVELEKWGLFGWTSTHQAYSISDIVYAEWHRPPVDVPPCEPSDDAASRLIRMPLDAQSGIYRICGLEDDRGCIEFSVVPFEPGEPGP